MPFLFFPTPLRHLALSVFLFLSTSAAFAQTTASAMHGYDFLTVVSSETTNRLFIIPAFQGKSEIQLEDFNGLLNEKNVAKLQHNTILINQQLSALTVAGWELTQTYTAAYGPMGGTTRYLFRKAKD